MVQLLLLLIAQRFKLRDQPLTVQTHYWGRHIYKELIQCTTSGGTVSLISDVCGGDMSDVEVVRKSGLLDKLTRNYKIRTNKGFSNKDNFLIERSDLLHLKS